MSTNTRILRTLFVLGFILHGVHTEAGVPGAATTIKSTSPPTKPAAEMIAATSQASTKATTSGVQTTTTVVTALQATTSQIATQKVTTPLITGASTSVNTTPHPTTTHPTTTHPTTTHPTTTHPMTTHPTTTQPTSTSVSLLTTQSTSSTESSAVSDKKYATEFNAESTTLPSNQSTTPYNNSTSIIPTSPNPTPIPVNITSTTGTKQTTNTISVPEHTEQQTSSSTSSIPTTTASSLQTTNQSKATIKDTNNLGLIPGSTTTITSTTFHKEYKTTASQRPPQSTEEETVVIDGKENKTNPRTQACKVFLNKFQNGTLGQCKLKVTNVNGHLTFSSVVLTVNPSMADEIYSEYLKVSSVNPTQAEPRSNDDDVPETLIAIVASCGALVFILLAFAIYCTYHRKSYRKNQQPLTEELQTVENGYHDNPTLEVMEVQPEMQEKKLALNGEFNDSWIVPFDNLTKDDIPDEEDTHL